MKSKVLRIGLVPVVLIAALMLVPLTGTQATAATPAEIEAAIEAGVACLAGVPGGIPGDCGDSSGADQNANGSWFDNTAMTCLALVKLQERAHELGWSPFDPAYPYSENVVAGWEYVFSGGRTVMQTPLPDQDHTLGASGTVDDPDTSANGYGVYFQYDNFHNNYTTGICLMALEASGTPNRQNDGGLDFDAVGGPDTFQELAQEAVDWLAFSQTDGVGTGEGGWDYNFHDNSGSRSDNSITGYVLMGLAAGEGFGCTVPGWVRTELNQWIDYIQDASGGSGYSSPGNWVNALKTGNLLFEMTFVGDTPATPRFEDALTYIENHWQDTGTSSGTPIGWRYSLSPADYQAMFTLMKGLQFSGVDLIDTEGGGGPRDDDWFNQEPPRVPAEDFATVLVAQQNADGSWPSCQWGNDALCTTWALLTLEKIIPPPQVTEIILEPETARNVGGEPHTVTATLMRGENPVPDILVDFYVISGPNAGEMSDPGTGECTVNDDCTTDEFGQVSWTYTGLKVGCCDENIDDIEACFTTAAGEIVCSNIVEKRWTVCPGPWCDGWFWPWGTCGGCGDSGWGGFFSWR